MYVCSSEINVLVKALWVERRMEVSAVDGCHM